MAKSTPPSPPPSRFQKFEKPWVWAFLLFTLAAAARILSGAGLFFKEVDPGYRNFEIFDSTYQMRRTEMIMDNFPSVPFYDTYHYYPDNPPIPWPPGYNLLLAALGKAYSFISPSRLAIETFVGLLPCFFDALSVIFFFFYFRRLAPPGSALLAGMMLALSTINITFSEAGYIDHHYFITFFIAAGCFLLARWNDRPDRNRSLLLGFFLGSGPFFNVSLIQFVLLFLAAASFYAWTRREDPAFRKAVTFVLSGSLLSSLLSAFSTPVGRAGGLVYDQTSLFQFGMILLFSAGVFLFFLWTVDPSEKKASRWPLTAAIAAVIGGLGMLALPQAKEGARFLFAGNLLNYIQGEEQSIFSYFPTWPLVFTWWVLFFPFGVWALAKKFRTSPLFTAQAVLFLSYGLFSGLSHFLYLQFLFPWYALCAALGVHFIMEKLKKPMGFPRYALLIPFFIQMGVTGWNKAWAKGPAEIQERDSIAQTIQAFQWMRENTPRTSYHERGDGRPEYSVWAFRDHGHQLARIAQRPAVVSPFSTPDFVDHMKDYARYVFTKDEGAVDRLLDQYDSRYLLLDHRNYSLKNFFLHLLESEPGFSSYKRDADDLPFLFCNNLLFFDGELRWRKTPAVRHFRLVYEVRKKVSVPLSSSGKAFNHSFNGLKIFERVPGAVLRGRGYRPGERVVAKLPLQTNTGRTWTYTHYDEADAQGNVTLVVPYPTEPISGSGVFPLANSYFIEGGKGSAGRRLSVSADQVQNGQTLTF